MWTRIGLVLGLLVGVAAPAFADGFVETSGTYAEGAPLRGFRFDVNGALKITPATLYSGEDQTNNLLMTSGGAVRSTTMASAVSTNTTSAVTQPPTGSKSIQGILTCNAGGSTNCGITFTVYGSALNTQATGTKVTLCTATIPTGAAVTSEACPVITAAYLYMWIETTGVAGTSPSLTVTAMY